MTDKRYTKALIAAFGVYTIWGFSFMASKVAQELLTPFVLLMWRFDIAAAVLSIPLLLGKQKLRLRGKSILPLILLGAMEPCIYFIGEQYGLRFSNSAFSGIMIAIIPIVTMFFASIFLREKPSAAQWFFSALSIGGIIAITLSENSGGEIQPLGIIFLIIAVFTGSGYGILSRKSSDSFSVYERSWFMQAMGAVFFTVLAVFEQKECPGTLFVAFTDLRCILSVLYLALGASVAGYVLFNYAVSKAPMANVISLCNLTTLISVLAGVLILGEPFSASSLLAMAVVIIGIIGVQKFPPEAKQNLQ